MYRRHIEEIKFKLMAGLISYDEAKQQATPIINEMNEKGKQIAKKYGQRFTKFTFTGLMR